MDEKTKGPGQTTYSHARRFQGIENLAGILIRSIIKGQSECIGLGAAGDDCAVGYARGSGNNPDRSVGQCCHKITA